MKTGSVVGGIALGALLGLGVGYVLGLDAEKKNQWVKLLGEKLEKVRGKECTCETPAEGQRSEV
ncbi:hypothetical protein AwDysgo_17490 [Bacteroidales bacterium]|nr:hypothetical protein AwDysgo_17490 [Bacteroidales bacterium]